METTFEQALDALVHQHLFGSDENFATIDEVIEALSEKIAELKATQSDI
jgi:hypothetical protein